MSPRCLRGSFFVARTALIRSPAIGRVPRGSSANFLHSRPVSPRGFRRRDQDGDQFRARAESPAPSGGALRDAGGARILRSLRPPAPWGLEHSWDLPIGRAEKRRSDVRVGIPTQQPTGWLAVEAGCLPAFWVLRIARSALAQDARQREPRRAPFASPRVARRRALSLSSVVLLGLVSQGGSYRSDQFLPCLLQIVLSHPR
jgi:hypothetical protein